MKKKFFLVLLTAVSYFVVHGTVLARAVKCFGSTTQVIGYRNVFTISSSTNGTAFTPFGFAEPYYIQCNTPDYFSYTTQASTTGCGNKVALFNISSSSVKNVHVEDPSVGQYGTTFCATSWDTTNYYGLATTTTQMNNCDGYGTTLFSAPLIFNTSGNSHIGGPDAYPLKRCLTLITRQSLSVSFSSNSVGFGQLSPSFTTYATSNGQGTTTALNGTSSSMSLTVDTGGDFDYAVTVTGDTLTNGSNTISAMGGTPAALTPGTDQFGLSIVDECVSLVQCTGLATTTVAYPYNTTNYAYDATAASSSLIVYMLRRPGVAADGFVYRIKMAANIANNAVGGTYTTNLTFIVTPTF